MDNAIDFDQLQNEINEAERYLREEVLRTKAQGFGRTFLSVKEDKTSISGSVKASSEKNSTPVTSANNVVSNKNEQIRLTTPTSSEHSTPKKYANPESREKLLSRLMSEHGSKQSTPSSSRSSGTAHAFNLSVSNRDDHSGTHGISTFDSSDSPVYSSKSTTPFRDHDSDSVAVDRRGQSESESFFDTIKKYSDVDPRTDETLFFASDVVASSYQNDGEQFVSNHDTDGKGLMSLYSANQNDLFQEDNNSSRRGRSNSPTLFTNKTNTNRRPASAASIPRRTLSTKTNSGTIAGASRMARDVSTESSRRKILKSKEEILVEAESKFNEQHTFQPKVKSEKPRHGDGHEKGERSLDRIDAMIQVHSKSLANRERQKIELDRAKVQHTCSFKPQLSKGTQFIIREKTKEMRLESQDAALTGGKTTDRLYMQAGKHQIQQRMLRHQFDEARNSECTFKPALNPNSSSMVESSVEHRPLYERVGEVQRQQAMNRQVLLECYEEEGASNMKSRPEINEKSRKMIEKGRGADSREEFSREPTDVGSRLLNEARQQQNRKFDLIEKREKELADNMKNPGLCKGSQTIVSRNPIISNSSFIKRQEDHAKKVDGNINDTRRKEEVESNTWFKPDISSKTNHILSEHRPEVVEATPEERAMRLYRDDAENIERRRREIEDEMYGSINFVPSIDPISKELGRSTGIQELSENKRGHRIRIKARQRYEKKESEECTFRPQTNQSQNSYNKELYSSGKGRAGPNLFAPHIAWDDVDCPLHSSNSKVNDTSGGDRKVAGSINMREPERMAREIRLHQLEKDEKRRAALIVREIDDLQECSFQPQIYRQPAKKKSSRPIVVQGVGRHFELKYMKQKQDDDARQRKEDAFRVKNVDKFRKASDGSTMVEPFRIAPSSNRRSRAAAELEQNRNSELTFHPATKDHNRRESARQFLEKSSQLHNSYSVYSASS